MAWSFIKVVVIVLLNRFFDSSPPSSFPLPLFVKGILLLHSLTVVYYYAYVVLSSSAVAAQQAQHIPLFRLYSFQSFFAPVSFYSFSFLLFLFFFRFADTQNSLSSSFPRDSPLPLLQREYLALVSSFHNSPQLDSYSNFSGFASSQTMNGIKALEIRIYWNSVVVSQLCCHRLWKIFNHNATMLLFVL